MPLAITMQSVLLLIVSMVLLVTGNDDMVELNAQTKAELFITSRLDWNKIFGLVEDQLYYFATGKVEHFAELGTGRGRSGIGEYIWHNYILEQIPAMHEKGISDIKSHGDYMNLQMTSAYLRIIISLLNMPMPTSGGNSQENTTGYFNLEGLFKSFKKSSYRTIRNIQDKLDDFTRLYEFAADLQYDLEDPVNQNELNSWNRRMDASLKEENPLDVLKGSQIMDESELFRIENAIINVGPDSVTKTLSKIIKKALKSGEGKNGENSVEVK